MKKYIGTKIIEAEPAYRVVDAEGNVRVVTEAAEAKRCGTVDLGYKVRYPDGYESFSPKGAFDDAYHPLIGMTFGLALEALRKGNNPDEHCPQFSGAEVELADVVIRIMDMAEARGWNVAGAIVAKHEFNKTRPYKHGKEF